MTNAADHPPSFIIFLAAMYVLILKRKAMVPKCVSSPVLPAPTDDPRRFLVVLSILLFTLSTAHVALVMRQLLEAFIFAEPGTASVYFAEQHNRLPNTKLVLYSLNVCAQDLVLVRAPLPTQENCSMTNTLPDMATLGCLGPKMVDRSAFREPFPDCPAGLA